MTFGPLNGRKECRGDRLQTRGRVIPLTTKAELPKPESWETLWLKGCWGAREKKKKKNQIKTTAGTFLIEIGGR